MSGLFVDCDCTKIAQDETCPVGYPSLLCETCDGKGVLPYVEQDASELTAGRSVQKQDVTNLITEFERYHPELYWHIAKGKITAGEPRYGAIITTVMGVEIGHGESDVSAEDAFRIAIDVATQRVRAVLSTPSTN